MVNIHRVPVLEPEMVVVDHCSLEARSCLARTVTFPFDTISVLSATYRIDRSAFAHMCGGDRGLSKSLLHGYSVRNLFGSSLLVERLAPLFCLFRDTWRWFVWLNSNNIVLLRSISPDLSHSFTRRLFFCLGVAFRCIAGTVWSVVGSAFRLGCCEARASVVTAVLSPVWSVQLSVSCCTNRKCFFHFLS